MKRSTVAAAVLLGCLATAAAQDIPPHISRTERAVRDVTIQSGWVPFGQPVPVTLEETETAIWYLREGSGVRWIQSPATPGGPSPHYAVMGVRFDVAGGDSLVFEDHERGILAVVPSRDRRP